MAEPHGPPIEDWAGERGTSWAANVDRFESMIAPPGAALMAQAAFRSGERVVDVGCGGGATSRAIAQAVGPNGAVVGFDISADLVRLAAERSSGAASGNLRFVHGDAGRDLPPGVPFDRLFSRFGSMFFADAAAGFANLHRMIRPGGTIDLAVWAPARDNGWMAEMTGVVRAHLDLPPAVPRAPGPFAFDDPDYLLEILTGAGFRDATITAWTGEQPVGGAGASAAEAAAFILRAMAFSSALAERGEAVVKTVEAALTELFQRHHRPDEGVMMTGKAWLVRACA